ncbi:MAG TPA: enoyl-CoA hydratase-related protein, partial [Longimicrobiales bacterium]|nr:enoyl-CoA hydratase-related protein [Longimicrobiales bacterium]
MRAFESRPANSFEFAEILYDKRDWVATITINRPSAYNAYSTTALQELAAAFRDAAFDDAVGVIVLTGAGHAAFCTGGDVKEYEAEYTVRPRDYWKYMQYFRAYIESIVTGGKPVIARLNGMAVGGGNESHLACDLSVMAQHAWLGQVGTRVGSVAAGGATQWLPLFVGDRRAREMLLLNERIPAQQALEWGLVNRVVPSVTHRGDFVEQATTEQIRWAQQNKDGWSIDLTLLDEAVRELADRLPVFGICLGHQILGLALGGETKKLKFGHHGGNQPGQDLATRKVAICAENHGYAVEAESLRRAGEPVEITHVN